MCKTNSNIQEALLKAAEEVLPTREVRRKRPWISGQTLGALEDRLAARRSGAHAEVEELNRRIRKFVRRDREVWLRDLAGSRDWTKLKALAISRHPDTAVSTATSQFNLFEYTSGCIKSSRF